MLDEINKLLAQHNLPPIVLHKLTSEDIDYIAMRNTQIDRRKRLCDEMRQEMNDALEHAKQVIADHSFIV